MCKFLPSIFVFATLGETSCCVFTWVLPTSLQGTPYVHVREGAIQTQVPHGRNQTRTVAYSKMRSSFLLKSVAVHGTTMQIVTLNFSLVPEAFVMVMGCYSEAFVIVMLF